MGKGIDMIKKLKAIYNSQHSFDDRMFFIILVTKVLFLFLSTIVTMFENVSKYAIIVFVISDLFTIGTFVWAFLLSDLKNAKLFFCIISNFVLTPISFFFNGALSSGMILNMLASLLIIVPLLKGRQRMTIFILNTLLDTGIILLAYLVDDLDIKVVPKVSLIYTALDYSVSFIVNAFFTFALMSLIFRAYNSEREKNEQAMKKLEIASMRDALTGLSNRRYLYEKLEELDEDLFSHDYYMAMFDIDFFKKINDTYGHLFGDKALKNIANEIKKCTNEDAFEISARYGGEEFVFLLKASRKEEAYKRVDNIRRSVEKLKWEEKDSPITISGGLLHCSDYRDLTIMMSKVDSLLYKAKSCGRNCICKEL